MTESAQCQGRQLVDLLTRQRDLYCRLRELAAAQSGAIDRERPEDLLRILGDRQRLISELAEVNDQLEPYRSRWGELREAMEPDRREHAGELVAQVQELLKEILDQDQGDCDALKQRTEAYRGGAAAASVGKQINAAYAAGQYTAAKPRYVDRCDEEGDGS